MTAVAMKKKPQGEPQKPKAVYLKDYAPPSHHVTFVNLTFQIFDHYTLVTQRAHYLRRSPKRCDLTLNGGDDMELVSVKVNGVQPKSYAVEENKLVIPCPGDEFEVEIITKIWPEKNTALEGLYKSGGNYTTQCEAEGFRNITCWMDRPDVMTIFTVRIEADKKTCPVLLSNGNCIETGDLEGGRHYAVWHDPHKKPCYLFALVAGDLVYTQDDFTTMSGQKVTLRIYTRQGDLPQVQFAMQAVKDSMEWDEKAYGCVYDLDVFNIVAISDFNMGAMENKSLNIFNTALILAQRETATDADFLRVQRVIGHEYFHNWSGNRVTCRDWFQLSLKEGFTVYRENQFGQAMNDPVTERIDEVEMLRDLQFAEDASPMAHPIRPDNYIEINNFYTMTVYEKGGEVIRMMNTILGDDIYRKGCDIYFSRYDGQAVTCDDFVRAMQDASANKHLEQFKLWYSQAGTPRVTARSSYDESKKKLTVFFTQSIPDTPGQTDKKPMVIPIVTGLLDKGGKAIAQSTLILTEQSQKFVFDDVKEKPVMSYLRGFSAPVILETDQTDDDYLFLLGHDSDGFNRWEAGQHLMMACLQGKSDPSPLIKVLKAAIGSMKDTDKALLVRLLTLPKDSVIANSQKVIDPDAIAKSKRQLEKAIATGLNNELDMLYGLCSPDKTFSTTPESMARRALRNLVLHYKSTINESEAVRLAYAQYQDAYTMTERLGALSILVQTDRPEREHVLNSFYEDYKHHALVIDKWFSVQACAPRHDTCARVKTLLDHKDFTLTNPNRVRALVGAFAMRNMQAFHTVSGEGYDLLADTVIRLNEINPQIASRMLTPMRNWKSYTADRQQLMKAQLKRILDTNNLSPNVYEVVSKCLES